jgi:hypothetical protein
MTQQTDGERLRAEVRANGAEGELLARIDERVGFVLRAQDQASVERTAIVSDVTEIKASQAACDANWNAQRDINADLRQKKNIGDAVGYALATAAAFFGAKVNL